MVKKLLDKVLVYFTVSGSLEYPRKKDTILSVCRKNIISAISMKASNLYRSYTERRPTSSPEADPFVTPRLVYINEMIRTELGQVMQVIVSEIGVALLGYMASNLFSLSDGLQCSADAVRYGMNAKLIIWEDGHLVLV
jgi:hypothetical protein